MYRVSIKNNLKLTKNLLYILNGFSYKFPILETTASWDTPTLETTASWVFPYFRNYNEISLFYIFFL
jgi:hypothetical protein